MLVVGAKLHESEPQYVHDPKLRLLHVRDYAQDAMSMVEGETRPDLGTDNKLLLALTRPVELVGGAASRLPEELRA